MTVQQMAKAHQRLAAPLRRWALIAGLTAAAILAGITGVSAADVIRVGKASAVTFAFAPIEIGTAKGIWAKYGLEVESIGFGGDARLQQAMVANSIDFALGSGPGMGFLAKGVPATTVAAMANEPLSMGLTIGNPSPIKRYEDLKGAPISVSTVGSLTMWLAREFSRRMGWGPMGIKTVPLGVNQAQVAALKAGQVQGFVASSSLGYVLEKAGQGRVLVEFGDHAACAWLCAGRFRTAHVLVVDRPRYPASCAVRRRQSKEHAGSQRRLRRARGGQLYAGAGARRRRGRQHQPDPRRRT
jgi:ABC-type nitrate/sulfonate/bicarbonate transport system substrate-binding protein